MTAIDWTVLGITELVLAVIVAAVASGLLAWRRPMAPLASAVIAGSMAGGLVLLFGRAYPAVVVLAGGAAAAIAGLLYDRAVLPQPGLALAEAGIAALTAAFAIPLVLFGRSLGVDLPGPVPVAFVAVLVPAFSFAMRRWDRLPGGAASIGAACAGLGTLFAVWRGVVETQSIWFLATLGTLCVVFAVISRARATPLGAAGTSYLALTIAILVMIVIAFARLAG